MNKSIPGLKEITLVLPDFILDNKYNIEEILFTETAEGVCDIHFSLELDDNHTLIIECYAIDKFTLPVFYDSHTFLKSLNIRHIADWQWENLMWLIEDYKSPDVSGYCKDIFLRLK